MLKKNNLVVLKSGHAMRNPVKKDNKKQINMDSTKTDKKTVLVKKHTAHIKQQKAIPHTKQHKHNKHNKHDKCDKAHKHHNCHNNKSSSSSSSTCISKNNTETTCINSSAVIHPPSSTATVTYIDEIMTGNYFKGINKFSRNNNEGTYLDKNDGSIYEWNGHQLIRKYPKKPFAPYIYLCTDNDLCTVYKNNDGKIMIDTYASKHNSIVGDVVIEGKSGKTYQFQQNKEWKLMNNI